ncbi:MAG: tetratricopeptide repeat protein [Candidatus Omnitrophica bacterium]|nr:tetratricopeptide repeat protein [Candidatus Omnitrophota bacterium]
MPITPITADSQRRFPRISGHLRSHLPQSASSWFKILIILTGLWAYHNSFGGPFIFDDIPAIVTNRHVHHLWPLWDVLTAAERGAFNGRPLITFTLALNYALGGVTVWGYHAVNLAIHLAASLALFGIARRTIRMRQRLPEGPGTSGAAEGLALAVALIWLVHPLQTASVTYIIQRSESLMGLCYCAALYSVIRSAEAAHPRRWRMAAVVWCGLGMASKPSMATLPFVAFAYDRFVLSRTEADARCQRRSLFLSLITVCAIIGGVLPFITVLAAPEASFPYQPVTPWAYLLTQTKVVWHYLRLVVWPSPLALDYAWPLSTRLADVWPAALGCVAVLILIGWALRRAPVAGGLAAIAVALLALSSSVVPLADAACEYRMYLPLAPIIALIVLGAWRLLGRFAPPSARPRIAAGLLAVSVVVLGSRTIRRNADYRSSDAIWAATVAARPDNPRARLYLGNALIDAGRRDEARAQLTRALQLKPDYAEAHSNLGKILEQQGDLGAAMRRYQRALAINPLLIEAHNNAANVHMRLGQPSAAIAAYHRALQIAPHAATVRYNLGNAYAQQDRWAEAAAAYAAAIRDDPTLAEARLNFGNVLLHQGKTLDAIAQYAELLRQQPAHAAARRNLAAARQRLTSDP